MAAVTDAQIEAVRALVAAIPPGRVSTYGNVARQGRIPLREVRHAF